MGQSRYTYQSLILGRSRVDLVVVTSRHGQNLASVTDNFKCFFYNPSERPPIWCVRFWFRRIFLAKKIPAELRTLVTIARLLSAKGILSTDSYSALADAEPYLGSVKLFWVQHGLFLDQRFDTLKRELEPPDRSSSITLFAVSPYDIENYRRWGVRPAQTLPVGSLQNSYFLKNVRRAGKSHDSYDICLIEKGIKVHPDSELGRMRKASWQSFLNDFNQLCKTRDLRVVVALSRSSDITNTLAWIRTILTCDFKVTELQDEFSTYKAVDASTLTIGQASTVLIEALCRERKVLGFNYTSLGYWDLPGSGISHINSPSYELLCKRIDTLLPMSWESYWSNAPKEIKDLTVDEPGETISTINTMLHSALQNKRSTH